MTRFEKLALTSSLGMVAVLFGMSILSPVDYETMAPKAVFGLDAGTLAKNGVEKNRLPDVFDTVEVRTHAELRISKPLHSVETLSATFSRMDYDLVSVINGTREVPPVFLSSMPSGLSELREVKIRKQLFFQTLLPLVLQSNAEISQDRHRLTGLVELARQGGDIAAADRLWLIVLAERYKVKRNDYQELLRRVDVIAPSLALAQAAEESGWGTSRFAREGNAIFGEWTNVKNAGIVPANRDAGKTHQIRAFDNLLDSVRAYMRNLNTHRAYRGLRLVRFEMRQQNIAVTGVKLVEQLESYSERGDDYVITLRAIISTNKLRLLDHARLGDVMLANTKSLI